MLKEPAIDTEQSPAIAIPTSHPMVGLFFLDLSGRSGVSCLSLSARRTASLYERYSYALKKAQGKMD